MEESLIVGVLYLVYYTIVTVLYSVYLIVEFLAMGIRELVLFFTCEIPYHVYQYKVRRAVAHGDWTRWQELRG